MKSKGWLCLLIVASCTRAPSTTFPIPESGVIPEQSAKPADSRPASWSFAPDFSPRSYIAVESTTVTLDARSDSSVTQTSFVIALQQLTSYSTVRGTIDRVTGGNAASAELLPIMFSGSLHNGGLTLDSLGGKPVPTVLMCDTPAMSRLGTIRRNVFAAPPMLSRNQSWTDSTTVPACSGTVPVQVTSVRTYRVVGETDGGVLIERQDRILASGEGAQGQHRITIQSRGTGSGRLEIDRVTGALTSATGSTRLEVDVQSSGRVQRFIQVVRDRVAVQR